MYKTHHGRSTFGSWDVEKVHAVVARSTFRSQNAKNTRGSDHFWKFRSRKSARRCVAKHISKSKCYKAHQGFGPLLEVEVSKKVHAVVARSTFRSQNVQNTRGSDHFGSSDLEKVHAVAPRSTFRSQNVKNTRGLDHFWRFRCRFASIQDITLHYTPVHYSTLHYAPVHSTTLNYTTPHYITLNDTATQIDR